MAERYLFSDEVGDFTFRRDNNISRYFILCTVTTSSLAIGDALHKLRHELVWGDAPDLGDCFHATTDSQAIRDRVYQTIMQHPFKVQATICEKAKAEPQVRVSKARFYKIPWFYHLKHGISRHLASGDKLLVTTAAIGTKKERLTFCNDLDDVMRQTLAPGCWKVDFRPSLADPCLQVADYCGWAIGRKWERGDTRSYDIIKDRITYEYDLWARGTKLHY